MDVHVKFHHIWQDHIAHSMEVIAMVEWVMRNTRYSSRLSLLFVFLSCARHGIIWAGSSLLSSLEDICCCCSGVLFSLLPSSTVGAISLLEGSCCLSTSSGFEGFVFLSSTTRGVYKYVLRKSSQENITKVNIQLCITKYKWQTHSYLMCNLIFRNKLCRMLMAFQCSVKQWSCRLHPEDENYNIWQRIGKPSTFYVTYSWEPKLYIKLQLSKPKTKDIIT